MLRVDRSEEAFARPEHNGLSTPLSPNGMSPLDNQSNKGPGWSSLSAMNPSTDTELYMTTLPTA